MVTEVRTEAAPDAGADAGVAAAATFVTELQGLSGPDLRRLAQSLQSDSLTDEVDWWRATIAVDKLLRHTRRSREAAHVASLASHAVQHAAIVAGIDLPDDDVTRVARAAADVARGLAAGRAARPIVGLLLEHWMVVGAGNASAPGRRSAVHNL
jgi:hypothetical protein